MNGGNERGRDKDGGTSTAHVPIGWQRAVEGGRVAYISPSGTVLSTVEEVRTYLLTDGTCKCGLECPLVIPKVFNFDPGAAVKPHSTEEVKAEEDMTKLCNHRRKVVAMAALCRSMEASPLALPSQAPGGALNYLENPSAAHSRSPNAGLNKSPPDFKNNLFPKYFMDKTASGVGPPILGPKQDHCTYPRQRLPNPGGLTQYPRHHPPIPATAGLNPLSKNSMYAGGYPSNGSLDAITRANSRLSPELPHLGSPQPGRNLMPSPAQSPRAFGQAGNMPCSSGSQKYPRFTNPPNQTYDLSGCSDHLKGSPYLNSLPPSAQSHTHALDIHVSSTLASLANSLGGRSMHEVQGNFPPSSFSARSNTMGSPSTFSSSISSPAGSLEMSPQRSRHSSTSSEHGFLGQQVTKSSHSPMPMSSPKFFMPPSPKSRLEGILQQYKDTSNSGSNSLGNHHHPHQSNNFQPPHPPHSPTLEKKVQASGAASASGFLGLPLGQILNQHHPHSSSFPASSLLSAAAKAQLASQKNSSSAGKEAHTKVLSTLQNSHPNRQTSPLLSNSNTTPSSPAPQDKPFKRKRQRRSPTVLSMLKESQMNSLRTGVDQLSMGKTSFTLPLGAPQQQPMDLNPGLNQSDSVQSTGFPRQAEAQDPLRSKTPGVGTAQPLSALLHLLSMQNAQGGGSSGSSLGQPGLQSQNPAAAPSPVHLPPFPQPNPGSDQALTPNFGGPSPSPSQQPFMNVNSNAALASVADPAGTTGDSSMFPGMQDLNSQLLGFLGQFSTQTSSSVSSSSSSSSSSPSAAQGSGSSNLAAQLKAPAATSEAVPGLPSSNSNHQHIQQSNTVTGPTNLPASPTSTNHKMASSPSPAALHTPCQQLPLAELFPFMNPDQLLQLLSTNTGLTPLLNPPFIGSLPLGLQLMGQQQHQQQPQNILNHNPLNLLPSLLGGQGDLPVNLLGLLNPPPNAVLPPSDPADKQALQALLTASLLLGQQQTAMLPLGGLNLGSLNLDFLQQQFPPPQDGDKPTDAPLLPGNDGFQGLGDGALQALQTLLFPALSTPAPPIPAALLSLNPALLAAFLGSTDGGANQTQVGISSSSMGPTSMTSTSTTTTPSSGAEAPPAMSMGDPLLSFSGAPGKLNPLPPQLLNPLLGANLLGDLAAFSTSSMQLSSLHTLLASSPLLLPGQQQHHLLPALQQPPLGMHLIQGQAALPGQAGTMNPMAGLLNTLQLNIDPGLPMADNKPINTTNQLEENISPAPAEDLPANQLPPEHLQTSQPLPQRSSPLDPYGSFMDAIYNSFLQVTGKKAQEAAGPTGHSVGQSGASGPSLSALSALAPTANLQASYPQFHGEATSLLAQNGLPSHSPRRACSVRNQDLTRLGMEAAHSPARGTPKLTEESRTPPRFEGVPADKANSRSNAQLLSSTPAFPGSLDEAKTDSSCKYSNGGHPRTEPACRQDEPPLFRGCTGEGGPSEGGGEEDPAQCLYPSSRADCLNGTVLCPIIDQEVHPAPHEPEEGKGDSVQQETPKRGRKRRQTQQKLNSSSKEAFTEDMANLDPKALAIQRPAKNKRRKIVR